MAKGHGNAGAATASAWGTWGHGLEQRWVAASHSLAAASLGGGTDWGGGDMWGLGNPPGCGGFVFPLIGDVNLGRLSARGAGRRHQLCRVGRAAFLIKLPVRRGGRAGARRARWPPWHRDRVTPLLSPEERGRGRTLPGEPPVPPGPGKPRPSLAPPQRARGHGTAMPSKMLSKHVPRAASQSRGMESAGSHGMESTGAHVPILHPQKPAQDPSPFSIPGTSRPPTPPHFFGGFTPPPSPGSFSILLFLPPLPANAKARC